MSTTFYQTHLTTHLQRSYTLMFIGYSIRAVWQKVPNSLLQVVLLPFHLAATSLLKKVVPKRRLLGRRQPLWNVSRLVIERLVACHLPMVIISRHPSMSQTPMTS